MLWLWQRFWGCCKIFFWIFVVEYQIPNLPWSESTFKSKFMACFLSVRIKLLITLRNHSPCSREISNDSLFQSLTSDVKCTYVHNKIRLGHQIDPNVQCLHTHLNSKNATGNGVLQTYRSSKLVNNQLTWSIFMPKILKFFDTITNISYTTFLKKIEKLGSRLEVEYFQACL